MSYPDWAVNHEKYNRAVGIVGPEGTDEALKEEYIKMGGFVKDVEVETPKEVDKPKKKAAKKK